jgi:hypothetical protein
MWPRSGPRHPAQSPRGGSWAFGIFEPKQSLQAGEARA